MVTNPRLKGLVHAAPGKRERRTVRAGVVDQFVHVLSEEVAFALVSQEAEARGICKGAGALRVKAIDALRGRVEQKPDHFVASPSILFRLFTLFQEFLELAGSLIRGVLEGLEQLLQSTDLAPQPRIREPASSRNSWKSVNNRK